MPVSDSPNLPEALDDFPCCTRDTFGRHEHNAIIIGGHNNEPTGPTPPADDVREAFTNGWYSARQNPGIAAATHSPDFPGEVRPRGTVTVAESEIVIRWLRRFAARGIVTINGKGGALEAAAEAQNA